MAGFLRRRIPFFVRRLITAIPAIALLAFGADPTRALVWSQVVLCFGIPFALIPLVWFTSQPHLMGQWVNRRGTTIAASAVAAAIAVIRNRLRGSTGAPNSVAKAKPVSPQRLPACRRSAA